MPISYKNKIYTTLGTPTVLSGDVVSATNNVGVPAKDYTVKGKTVVWNQMMDKSKFRFGQTFEGITSVNNGDGSFTLSGTSTGYYEYVLLNPTSIPTVSSHKYLLRGCPPGGQWAKKWGLSGLNTDESTDVGEGVVITGTTSISPIMYVWSSAGAANNLVFKPQLFDLTQMFGAGNEPATPAEFWQKVPEKLYGYNPSAYRAANIPSSKYFPDGMRSAGSAYDEINFLSQKAIKRIGAVDMGTLSWFYESATSHKRFFASVDGIKIASGSAKGNLVCPKYTTVSVDDVYLNTTDKTIAVHNALAQVWVYDSSYTDASAFKAAMSGVMLYYELATPVETAITPPLQALSTYKGFTSFSAPNSLTQNGPLSVTYYAEGGNNPESGWLTSYKRKLYMGKNIEWNQLLDKSKYPATTTTNGVTFTNNGDGSITVNGTAGSTTNVWHRLNANVEIPVGHKVLIGGGVTGAYWSSYLFYDDSDATYGIDSPGGGKIYTVQTSPVKPILFVAKGYTVSNITFKPQIFDLTQMFGAGNEPATLEEFWSYFDHKLYSYNSGETQPLFKISRKSQWGSNGSVTPAARIITVQETSFAPAVSKLCSLRKVRGSFAGTPTLYTTANNANKIDVGNNGYEWVTKVNDDNQIVSGNDFLDAFGINQTIDGTSLAGKTLGFMTHFSSRLSTTEGTDGGTFTSWGMSGEVEEIKSCAKENLYCVVYNSETDTVKVYTLDEYDPKYGTFSVSAEIGYNTMIAFMLDVTEDEV